MDAFQYWMRDAFPTMHLTAELEKKNVLERLMKTFRRLLRTHLQMLVKSARNQQTKSSLYNVCRRFVSHGYSFLILDHLECRELRRCFHLFFLFSVLLKVYLGVNAKDFICLAFSKCLFIIYEG